MDRLTPIFELGVSEAYAILTERLEVDRRTLPPLPALEKEDWGRDLLLSRFLEIPEDVLARAGLTLDAQDLDPSS
jgi:hypothetical protein